MLSHRTKAADRPRWTSAAWLLLAVVAGSTTSSHPAVGDDVKKDDEARPVKLSAPTPVKDVLKPFDLSYLPEDAKGIVAVRPSAAFLRSGMAPYRLMLNLWLGQQWSNLANSLGIDPAKSGLAPPRVEMFEEVTTVVKIFRTGGKKPDGRITMGDVTVVRTTQPVDWVTLFKTFKQEPTEAREGDKVYYKVKNPMFGPDGCFFCPDDRTLVLTSGKQMSLILNGKSPSTPAFAKGQDWDRFLRGLGMLALDNRDHGLAKVLKPDDSKDVNATALFDHADVWTFGLGNDDEIAFRAVATCADAAATESTARAAEALIGAARKGMEKAEPEKSPHPEEAEKARKMAGEFLKKARVGREGTSVLIRSSGLGTLADFASLMVAGVFD